ncbi:MAG: transposase [Promethearchaeota archaeon]
MSAPPASGRRRSVGVGVRSAICPRSWVWPSAGLPQRKDSPRPRRRRSFWGWCQTCRPRPSNPSSWPRVVHGAELHTDEYVSYQFATEAGYDHHTVNHQEKEYARHEPDRVVHCNTMEAIWSIVKPFLARFRGISKRLLHLRVAASSSYTTTLIYLSLISSPRH